MYNIINNLHSYLIFEILSYLIDDFDFIKFSIPPYPDDVTFYFRCIGIERNYGYKYEMLMINKNNYLYKKVYCKNKLYTMSISCIKKKKEIKNRYYLTFMSQNTEYVGCDCGYFDCRDSSCMDYFLEEDYNSIYISNDLNKALLLWYSIPEFTSILRVNNPSPISKIINKMNENFTPYLGVEC